MTEEENEKETRHGQGRRFKKRETFARRKRLLRFLNKFGWWAFDAELWSKQEGVSLTTVYEDREWLKEHAKIDVLDIEDLKAEVPTRYKRLMATAGMQAMAAETHADKQRYMAEYVRLTKGLTDFLEHFDLKTTPANNLRLEISQSEGMDRLEKNLAAVGITDPKGLITKSFVGELVNVDPLPDDDEEDDTDDDSDEREQA